MSQTETLEATSSDAWPISTQMEALKRVLLHAQSHEGDSRVTTGFFLCLYNGNRFPIDMTKFRLLDKPIFDDCLHIL